MRTIIFGATGMVGQGVLDACLRDDGVTDVLVVGRTPTGRTHPKLHEIHHGDFTDLTAIQEQLAGYDACFYCLGVSAAGRSEADYRTVSHDYPLAAARALLTASPDLAFCYVSGAGTDPTGRSRMMWARVKGETENALLELSPRAYMFRPALITPLPGTTSKTPWYTLLYRILAPLNPLLRRLAPRHVTSSTQLGQAMIRTAQDGPPGRVLATGDINEAAAARPQSP
ncbi:NAD-dependent epimerase/dehydratase family protein [Kitasatospora sp. YST-16]|uniref:NAD-dependent epimerase/dehydratase family protein n=1 Tax=Kitasatospora sp. YST-16 TaxID=2998080 RepID=UPI002283F15D|nr:NAD-dependent epimerase/dehydratase family protein [Kitasatospora sp. YST-16]WAL75780.1 NAD-dependent epimerase/dehydratase family protein [Kitasatospora sp. YST-16]WNW41848.1 NAD-dependent epimerase/dehydratase family protein [Streptomyces sp. Li-HN-5-13]